MAAERTTFNKSGETVFHFKRADPETADVSNGEPIISGSILSIAQHLFCDEHLRTPLSKQISGELDHLSSTPTGDGDIFYGPFRRSVNSAYESETLFVVRFHGDHGFADIFPLVRTLSAPQSATVLLPNPCN